MIFNLLNLLEHAPLISAITLPAIETWVFWLILLVVFLVIEAATVSLVSIWFAIGTLVALVLDLLGVSFLTQIIVMLLVSLVFFLIFVWGRRGRARDAYLPTNADRHIGRTARVTQTIDPIRGTGQILVDGLVWSAKTGDGKPIEEDRQVIIVSIQGVHALVQEVED